MKVARIIAISFLIYVGIVVAFESYYGYFQPAGYFQTTLVITTTAEDGTPNDRVLSRVESNGQLYVSANHWPRAWYNRALVNPKVQVTLDGEKGNYLAVPVTQEEHERTSNRDHIDRELRPRR